MAAFGAVIAAFIDLRVSAHGSVWRHLNGAVGFFLPIEFGGIWPNLVVALIIGLLGALSTLYFRPLSRKGGFACGFAVIGALSIFLP